MAAGSGTTVSQNRLVEALALAGAQTELLYPSHFATDADGLAERERINRELGPGLERFDVVLGVDGEGWLWAAKPRPQPYVAFCEAVLVEVLPFEEPASRALLSAQAEWEASAARSADAVVARSEFAAGRVAGAYGVPRERIMSLPIPFDVHAWRALLPDRAKRPLVLAVGHAYARKNYRGLLGAWPQVAAREPEAELAIVGTGPQLDELRSMVQGVPSARLLGHVTFAELLALYAEASVFCHPSLQENFGIAVLEGLACGASVVTHTLPSVMENTAGLPGVWTVDTRDPEALAEALLAGLQAKVPWPAQRLQPLREKLDPLHVGRQLLGLLGSLSPPR